MESTRFCRGCQNFSDQTPSCFLLRHHSRQPYACPIGYRFRNHLITALLMLGDPGLAPCKQDSMCAFIAVAFKIYLF